MLNATTIDSLLTWLLRLEDRSLAALTTNLSDGAGPTRLGITSRDSALVPPTYFTTMSAADAIAAAKTYYLRFWWTRYQVNEKCGDNIPLCAAYLSCAVNAGIGTAFDCLMKSQHDPSSATLTDKFSYYWIEHYYDVVEHNPNDERFLSGWLNRARAIYPNLPS